MPVDLSFAIDVIGTLETGTFAVERRPNAPPVYGIQTTGQPAEFIRFNITASAQPAGGKELLRLPELRRTEETRVIYTLAELFTGGQGQPYLSDLVTMDGEKWEVQNVEKWQDGTGYYKVLAQRQAQ